MRPAKTLCRFHSPVSRREFAARVCRGAAGLVISRHHIVARDGDPSPVALARDADRSRAVAAALAQLGRMDFGGRDLVLKGNYNSPDPYPATTHPEMLRHVVAWLRGSHCGAITLAERSGMGDTRKIWDILGIPDLAQRLGIKLLALETLTADDWRREDLPGCGWKNGIEVPRFLDHDAYVIQIANLKTHRFGAIFSASLKNSLGLVAKYGLVNAGYNYMAELHASPQQGALIAEANLVYAPKLVILDAMQVFISGGPDAGEIASPEIVMAGSDRVALDAAGYALLRLHSEAASPEPLPLPVYDQDQLKRAVELNLGARNINEIRFLTPNSRAALLASQLEALLQPEEAKSKK
jgi:uncharacterized protein (DUF362 family)